MLRATLAIALFVSVLHAAAADDTIDFNQDIRPLLSDNCYACHGPDEGQRQGGFRLDVKDQAYGEADSGQRPIVPGDVEASAIVDRITSDDPFVVMPPPDSNKSLTKAQIGLIRRWIEQGAQWEEHWSFMPPKLAPTPKVANTEWPRNDIDDFILGRLESENLQPSAPADKTTLLRRVTFDLTGLPPTPKEVDDFLADESPDAYVKVVDRLLKSPRYGEHRGRYWLDLARYGDTHGLHLDNYREMWLYRDWVVKAFNENMPYDQFTIEQLAGDLLPNPSDDQLIATGFNRCHVTTNEGGSIVEEVYVRNVVDRVVTTGTVFMGMTLECTRCHDHKYDPFTMRDFYSMFAFFNSIDGSAMDGNKKDPAPVLGVLQPEQKSQIGNLRHEIKQAKENIKQIVASINYVEPEESTEPQAAAPKEFVWMDDDLPAGAKPQGGWEFVEKPKPVFSGKKASTRKAAGLSQHFFTGASQPLKIAKGDKLFCYVYLDPKDTPKEIMLQFNDGSWDHRAYWGENRIDWGKDDSPSRRHMGKLPQAGEWTRLEVAAEEVGLKVGAMVNGWAFTQFDGVTYWDKAGIVSAANQKPSYESLTAWDRDQRAAGAGSLPADVQTIVKTDAEKRTEEQRQALLNYFLEHVYAGVREKVSPLHDKIEQNEKKIAQLEKNAPTTLIFRERKEPRPSFMLNRGEYDQQRDQVARATPTMLPPMPEGAPMNRLGLAQWLVDPSHPLTARVTVNRFWQQVFGVGLVKTTEDFGSQGEPPSHPKLLDHLAVRFMQNGWDVKELMREIVLSSTYRQSSRATAELIQRDPENRLLARGPRFRLDAEMLRDQALAVSELMVKEMGGPSVKPPQPDGLWHAVGYSGSNTVRFKADTGRDKVHRRTLYTFIKRTAPPPQMSAFDAPSRESCVARRERTNTPLQALLLMNDPQYVEAARAMAERAMREAGDSAESKAGMMFRLCTARHPDGEELAELIALFEESLSTYTSDEASAKKLIAVGESKPDEKLPAARLAAWTIVANLILNMDEVVTKN